MCRLLNESESIWQVGNKNDSELISVIKISTTDTSTVQTCPDFFLESMTTWLTGNFNDEVFGKSYNIYKPSLSTVKCLL